VIMFMAYPPLLHLILFVNKTPSFVTKNTRSCFQHLPVTLNSLVRVMIYSIP
jgi:hypothetical protein